MSIYLPQKPRPGFHAIQELTRAVNGLIDYLSALRFVGKDGIWVRQLMHEIQIGLEKKQEIEPFESSSGESSSGESSSGESSSGESSSGESSSGESSSGESGSGSGSGSGSSSGEPIDCNDVKLKNYYVYGTWEVQYINCETGKVAFSQKSIFNGDQYSIAQDCFDEDCYECYLHDLISFADGGCRRIEGEPNHIVIYSCAPGGYGPYGPVQKIFSYGKHELPLWDKSGRNCGEDEPFIGIVKSVPKMIVEITRRDE